MRYNIKPWTSRFSQAFLPFLLCFFYSFTVLVALHSLKRMKEDKVKGDNVWKEDETCLTDPDESDRLANWISVLLFFSFHAGKKNVSHDGKWDQNKAATSLVLMTKLPPSEEEREEKDVLWALCSFLEYLVHFVTNSGVKHTVCLKPHTSVLNTLYFMCKSTDEYADKCSVLSAHKTVTAERWLFHTSTIICHKFLQTYS